jgi:hydroxysqualene dehydroxylase
MTAKRVLIIGGGFAGLAAGVDLSERGAIVTVLERRGHLGGRAYSFTDQKTGDVVDNGQHLFMGCYQHTIAFLKKIGCLDRLMFQDSPRIDFLDREHGYTSFKCPPWPAPLHAVAGLLKLRGLTLGDKLRVVKVGQAIRQNEKSGTDQLTVKDWLAHLGQSELIRERFWYPMTIATLNEDPAIASAKMLKVVLNLGFGADRKAMSMGIARVGLSELYTEGATQFIESHGGAVRTSATVERLVVECGRIVTVDLKGGERLEADAVISAVPPAALLKMLPDELRSGEFAAIEKLRTSPIVSINLWFDRGVLDRQFVGLLGTRSQWLFNKNMIVKPTEASNQIAVIISAAHEYVDWTKEELIEMALGELHDLLPESRDAQLVHSRIVKEREATLSHTLESDQLRPGPRTSINNLILAGGWTATGLPDTIESAVLSGHTAAGLVATI